MSGILLWVVGSRGLLGSHLCRALPHQVPKARLWEAAPAHLSWTDPDRLAEELGEAVAAFAATVRAERTSWAVLWCAGRGILNSTSETLEPEWFAWSRLLELLGRHLARPSESLAGIVFLASSAGGIYGGSPGQVLTEYTPAQPNSLYGAHKLRMEQALRDWGEEFPSVSSLVGRISSLYGRGQDLHKAQGIIPHLSRCLIYRQPLNVFVSLDTRRDYLFVDDCAVQIAASVRRLMVEPARAVIKIIASEDLSSVARIVGIFFRMVKHRPLVVLRQPREKQRSSLKFRSEVWRDLEGLRKTDLATGIHLVHAHQLAIFRRGMLQPPS